MPSRLGIQAASASRTFIRSLQTTAPLPPPATSLPPISPLSPPPQSSSSTSKPSQASTSSPTKSTPSPSRTFSLNPTLPSHLPPLLPSTTPSQLPTTPSSALTLLKSHTTPSSSIYLTARLHSRTYLLHPRDILTLPRLKPLQPPGTTLSLSRILEVGSRDYAIRSPASNAKEMRKEMNWDARGLETLPDWVVGCQLTVLEHTRSPMEVRMKRKRRKGWHKIIKQRNGWTRLRVGDIVLGDGVPPMGEKEVELAVGKSSQEV